MLHICIKGSEEWCQLFLIKVEGIYRIVISFQTAEITTAWNRSHYYNFYRDLCSCSWFYTSGLYYFFVLGEHWEHEAYLWMWMLGNRSQWIPKEEIYSENFSGLKQGCIQFKVKFGNRKEFNSEKE